MDARPSTLRPLEVLYVEAAATSLLCCVSLCAAGQPVGGIPGVRGQTAGDAAALRWHPAGHEGKGDPGLCHGQVVRPGPGCQRGSGQEGVSGECPLCYHRPRNKQQVKPQQPCQISPHLKTERLLDVHFFFFSSFFLLLPLSRYSFFIFFWSVLLPFT